MRQSRIPRLAAEYLTGNVAWEKRKKNDCGSLCLLVIFEIGQKFSYPALQTEQCTLAIKICAQNFASNISSQRCFMHDRTCIVTSLIPYYAAELFTILGAVNH